VVVVVVMVVMVVVVVVVVRNPITTTTTTTTTSREPSTGLLGSGSAGLGWASRAIKNRAEPGQTAEAESDEGREG
jgi:hypothetical protein